MNTTDRRSEERNPFQTSDTTSVPQPRNDMAYRQMQRPQQMQPRQEIVKETPVTGQAQAKTLENAQVRKTDMRAQKKAKIAGVVSAAKRAVKLATAPLRAMFKGVKAVKLVIGAVSIIIVGCVVWFGMQWFTAPVRISDIHFERSLSSRTNDAPVKTEFDKGEPLMMVFEYKDAKPSTSAQVEVMKDGAKVRTISLPSLRGDETAQDTGKRYVSLVNGMSTQLDQGRYSVRIVANGDRTVGEKTVEVK